MQIAWRIEQNSRLVDVVNTLLVQHTLLDYAPEHVTHLGYCFGCMGPIDQEKLSSLYSLGRLACRGTNFY